MQRLDEAKRREILAAAARLFASRPFHEVRLEEVAEAAKVGKGTIYGYFSGKDDLYLTLIREGFAEMVAEARLHAASASHTWTRLRAVVSGLIRFGTAYPDLYRVMRGGILTADDPALQATRRELTALVESILDSGIRRGEISDPHPAITAQFILSFVRGVLLYPPSDYTPAVLEDHLIAVLRRGVETGRAP